MAPIASSASAAFMAVVATSSTPSAATTAFLEPAAAPRVSSTAVGTPQIQRAVLRGGDSDRGRTRDRWQPEAAGAIMGTMAAGAAVSAIVLGKALTRRSARCAPRHQTVRLRSAPTSSSFVGAKMAPRPRRSRVPRGASEEELDDRPSVEELQEIFIQAAGGGKLISLDDALDIPVIADLLDEKALEEDELEEVWGEPDDMLDFKGFANWYNEVLDIYDDYLENEAEKPPEEAFEDLKDAPEPEEDESGVKRRAYKDDELLEDLSVIDQEIKNVLQDTSVYGGNDEDDDEDEEPKELLVMNGRDNDEVTRLFKEQCNADNLLSWQAAKQISEIEELLRDGDIAESELTKFWEGLPKQKDCADILAFRTLLSMIDSLFEEEEDQEVKQEKRKKSGPRDAKAVKDALYAQCNKLLLEEEGGLDLENGPQLLGIGGMDAADGPVRKLCIELEKIFREENEDIEEWDPKTMCGDWELYYTTSAKMRRWGSVLNSGRNIKDAKLVTLVESFEYGDSQDLAPTYDIEELFDSGKEGEKIREMSMRGAGSWSVSEIANVVTGEDDFRVKLQINAVEHDEIDEDDPDGDMKTVNTNLKCLLGVSARTYCYSYISYIDDDLRITRTSLTGDLVFIYKKIAAEVDTRKVGFDPIEVSQFE